MIFVNFDEMLKNAKKVTTGTIEHKKYVYHPEGLFSQQIFGPIRDYTCACGKYVGSIFENHVCEECGVKIGPSSWRRSKYARIEFPIKVFHPLVLQQLAKSHKIREILTDTGIPADSFYYQLEEAFENKFANEELPFPAKFKNLPVLPPDLRPIYQIGLIMKLDDINDYYRSILFFLNESNKNVNNLEYVYFVQYKFLTQTVFALFEYLKQALSKKSGLLRQNIVAKELDFSARSVIVPDINLKHDEVGLPVQMIASIFKPKIINRLKSKYQPLYTNYQLDKFIREPTSCEISQDIYKTIQQLCDKKELQVLLNRQPTLHKSSIERFFVKPVSGKAIRIPPTIVVPFNADFDGDTMAVYAPLTKNANQQMDIYDSHRSALVPGSFSVEIVTQHAAYGFYRMTKDNPDENNIKLHLSDEDFEDLVSKIFSNPPAFYKWKNLEFSDTIKYKDTITTFGRLIASIVFGKEIKEVLNKSKVNKILTEYFRKYYETGDEKYKIDPQQIFRIGAEASRNMTISMEDILIDRSFVVKRREILKKFIKKSYTFEDIKKFKQIEKELTKLAIKSVTPITRAIIESGAKAKPDQFRQLFVCKGLITDITNKIIKLPILMSLYDGLDPKAYLLACISARKGSYDRSIRTADSGYLTRKMVYALQDLEYDPSNEDCGSNQYLVIKLEEDIAHLFIYRYFFDEEDNKLKLLTPDNLHKYIGKVMKFRSPMFCKSKKLCKKCVGLIPDLIQSKYIGILAAQAIGERCTQLVMRTFHTGGQATLSEKLMKIRYPKEYFEEDSESQLYVKKGYKFYIEEIPQDSLNQYGEFITDIEIEGIIANDKMEKEVTLTIIEGSVWLYHKTESIVADHKFPLLKLPDESSGIVTVTKYLNSIFSKQMLICDYPTPKLYLEILNLFKPYNILSLWIEAFFARLVMLPPSELPEIKNMIDRQFRFFYDGKEYKEGLFVKLLNIPYQRPLVGLAFQNYSKALNEITKYISANQTLLQNDLSILEKIILHQFKE